MRFFFLFYVIFSLTIPDDQPRRIQSVIDSLATEGIDNTQESLRNSSESVSMHLKSLDLTRVAYTVHTRRDKLLFLIDLARIDIK